MRRFLSAKVLLVAAAAVALFVGGAAFAASKTGSASPSFLDSLAQHLGISTQKLEDAAKAAANDQVDAALAAGRITQQQADDLKARIKDGKLPGRFGFGFGFGLGPGAGGPSAPGGGPFAGPGHRGFGFGFGLRGYLDAAATYLGLSQQDLMQQLAQGKSLAAIATAQGKTAAGLSQAILDAAKKSLDQAVTDKRITSDQETKILARLKTMVDKIVNATRKERVFGLRPSAGPGGPGGFGFGADPGGVGPRGERMGPRPGRWFGGQSAYHV